MFWFKRAPLVALAVCLWAVPACAFTFSYGNFFEIKDVQNQSGAPVLPLAGGKYRNVKIVSRELYRFLSQCAADCRYGAQEARFESSDYRQAFTNERMLIADVEFNGEIILTFLAFKNKDGIRVQAPREAVFKDGKLKERVLRYVKTLAEGAL